MKVRSHLVRLVIVVLAPLAVLAAALILQINARERAAAQQGLLAVARTLSDGVDTEVSRTLTALQLLARSQSLADGDLARFREQLAAARDIHGRWSNAALLDERGTRLINLRVPQDRSVVPGPDDTWRRALELMRPQVSNVFQPSTSPKPAVYVAVPVATAGARYVVAASIEYDLWSEVLSRHLPPGWVAAVDDRNGVIFARSERAEAFVGKPATRPIAELYSKNAEGTARSRNRENLEVYLGFHTSGLTGWHTLVIVPADLLEAPARESLLALLAGTVFILGLALAFAFYATRSLAAGIERMKHAIADLGRGRTPEFRPTSVDEMNEAGQTVREAAQRLAARDAEVSRLQLRLAERAEAAEEASRMKDQFLGMLGHELRNPLAAISGANGVLLSKLAGPERRMPEIIDRQTRHLASLVDGLLDVSRAAAGKLEIAPRADDLRRIVLEVHEALQASGVAGVGTIEVDAEPAPAHFDPQRMTQVVRNLLENALHHTPPDGHIRVTTRLEGAEAVLRVEDTGDGIEPALLERIFEPFSQAPQDIDRRRGGLGLGLAIARQIVARHGGRIDAASDGPARGAKFTVRIPAMAATPQRQDEQPPAGRGEPLRIALIEDLQDVREGLAYLLRAEGHHVDEACDADTGLALLRRQPPDVAFVDIGLPGASGHELVQRARACGLHCHLVALTGYGESAERARASAAGFDDFLVKPCTLEQLRAALAVAQPAARAAD